MSQAMISIDAFAQQRGVATRTVRRWLDAGRIGGAVKVGNRWSLPADAAVQDAPASSTSAGSELQLASSGHGHDMSGVTVAGVIAQLPVMLTLDVASRVLGVSEYALRKKAGYFELQRLGAHGAYVMPKARVRELDGRA